MDIAEGSLVRYNGTGTVGVVRAIKEEDDGQKWAMLDSTQLFYHISTLEPIERVPERKELGPMSLDDLKEKLKAKERMMEEAKMQDDNLETGG